MKHVIFKFAILAGMLIGLPMLGVMGAGYPISRYLEFPPETRYLPHTPFSWLGFGVFGTIIFSTLLFLFLLRRHRPDRIESAKPTSGNFPWWGWAGVLGGLAFWILAWTRFPWFAPYQPHTFSPLWFSYIVVVNALDYRRTNRCLMTDGPRFFLLLFPVSAGFWWFFEYLNRFVQNWYYVGVQFPAWEYFWYATLPFSTVLPAVLSTREWIRHAGGNPAQLGGESDIPHKKAGRSPGSRSKIPPSIGLILSGTGLMGIGIWPDYLFPLLWVSPLLILVSLQSLMGEKHIFSDLTPSKQWFLVSSAGAALICGFFWEMWNSCSLAKWEYSIPFVDRFPIFEMPILGYAGYLPFGLACAVIGEMLHRTETEPPLKMPSPRDMAAISEIVWDEEQKKVE